MTEQTDRVQPELEENSQIELRRQKLSKLRESGVAYKNDFKQKQFAAELHKAYEAFEKDDLAEKSIEVAIAGRIITRRLMGKASFVSMQDMTGRMQLYLRKADLPEGMYDEFLDYDLGDIVGVKGTMFKTKTGELSVKVADIVLLTKAVRPLPDKFHGLADQEMCYRQRYLDVLVNEKSRNTFYIRSKLVQALREFFIEHKFLEIETPMMHTLAGGAAAKPFVTHHNALDIPLYLRIAPELFLKRMVVGGLDRVFEINRNFRNEGLSTRHNPEFTMIEFYQAYATYTDLMNLTEELFKFLCDKVLGTNIVEYQGNTIDFSKPFTRISIPEIIKQYNSELTNEIVNDKEKLSAFARSIGMKLENSWGIGRIQLEIFEETAEEKLIQPTFITDYPKEVSPLARANDNNPEITDRFELFIAGREIANGFSELNDPDDQAERFKQQVADKEAGDDEAMPYDEDYITALEHGLAPTAGEGIGIDRLVMLFTDSPSIKDVILFPHMRPQVKL